MPPKRAQAKPAPAPFPLPSLDVAPSPPSKRKRGSGPVAKAAPSAKSRPASKPSTEVGLTRRGPTQEHLPTSSPCQTPSPSGSSKQTPLTSPTSSPKRSSFGSNALAGSSKTLVASQELPRFKLGSEASDDDDDDDHLIDGGFDLAVAAVLKGTSPLKQRADGLASATKARADAMLDEMGLGGKTEGRRWRQTQLPVGVEVGDACLVKSTNGYYLHGRLLSFEPAKQRGEADYYVAETIDQSAKDVKPLRVTRGKILFTCDGKLADCKIMETTYKMSTFSSDANIRPPTPPLVRKPTGRKAKRSFSDLSQQEQLFRIRPHLQRVINDDYPPAHKRLDLFHAGQYDAVQKLAKYGDIREEEAINVYGAEVRRWALRTERWRSVEKPQSIGEEPARPTGSARYERLSPQQRQKFVIDVLVPEAIVQICILSYDLTNKHADDQDAYNAAMAILDTLSTDDPVTKWQMVVDAIFSSRRRQRRLQGLKEENENEHEKALREQKDFNDAIDRGELIISSAGGEGRIRRRTDYRV